MKDRPIIMSGPMVCASLERRKNKTRRIVKPQPPEGWDRNCWFSAPVWGWTNEPSPTQNWHTVRCPYGQPGDLLWVREAHYLTDDGDREQVVYAEDAAAVAEHIAEVADLERQYPSDHWAAHRKLRSSIHMPRWSSRLTLEIADIRVERLNDISEADAVAEGVVWSEEWKAYVVPGVEHPNKDFPVLSRATAREMYAALWDVIHGPGAWLANPWVWSVSFNVYPCNIDKLLPQMATAG